MNDITYLGVRRSRLSTHHRAAGNQTLLHEVMDGDQRAVAAPDEEYACRGPWSLVLDNCIDTQPGRVTLVAACQGP